MFKTRPCGCKGIRSCKICESKYGAQKLAEAVSKSDAYVYCPYCKKIWPGWDTNINKHPNHSGEPILFPGIELVLDFLSPQEETDLLQHIDEVPWDLSQSGRYKQNYGPKCNFRKRKVSSKNFEGYPLFTKFIQDRFETLELLKSFDTVEQCSLDYTTDRGSSIDPHIDDCWIWGERIPTLSLLSDSVLTLTKFTGDSAKYNLKESYSYPRIVSESGYVRSYSDIANDYERLTTSRLVDEKDESHTAKGTVEKELLSQTSIGSEVEPCVPITIAKSKIGFENSTETGFSPIEEESALDRKSYVIRIPMPKRSLLILYGVARYDWEHSILREDIVERRVCITYRELTPPFLQFGSCSGLGEEIVKKGKQFWDHKTGIKT